MRSSRWPVIVATLIMSAVLPQAASAGQTIDTTGFTINNGGLFTRFDPNDFNDDGSEISQVFVAPAGVTKITKFSPKMFLGNSSTASNPATPQPQPLVLSLWGASGTGPGTQLTSTNVVAALGPNGLREFPLDWDVTAGTTYAITLGVIDTNVKAEAAWRRIADSAGDVLPGVSAWTRNPISGNPSSQVWSSSTLGATADLSFRLDFDGGVSTSPPDTGGGGGGTTTTTTTTTTTPGSGTPPVTPTLFKLPTAKVALKAKKGKKTYPATFFCKSGELKNCAVTVKAPKGTSSIKVRLLRGKTVVASGSATYAKSKRKKAATRTVTMKPLGTLQSGEYTVELQLKATGNEVAIESIEL